MKKSTIISIAVCAALVILVPLSVWAFKTGLAPKGQSGSFSRKTIDRIDFCVENTKFILQKPASGGTDYTVSFFFSAKKTQADFFGRIDSVQIKNLTYDNIVFVPQNEYCDASTLHHLLLPVADGEPAEVKWRADLTFTTQSAKTLNPVIEITYTSGMSRQTADTHILEIPLSITFQ